MFINLYIRKRIPELNKVQIEQPIVGDDDVVGNRRDFYNIVPPLCFMKAVVYVSFYIWSRLLLLKSEVCFKHAQQNQQNKHEISTNGVSFFFQHCSDKLFKCLNQLSFLLSRNWMKVLSRHYILSRHYNFGPIIWVEWKVISLYHCKMWYGFGSKLNESPLYHCKFAFILWLNHQ